MGIDFGYKSYAGERVRIVESSEENNEFHILQTLKLILETIMLTYFGF
jgi:hypothetical protein